MPVDAIGSTLGDTSSALTKSTLNQEDFLRLFLTELNFQDPLEPLNNREFLAQMAQFSSLEQSRQATEQMENLVFMNSTAQSVGLLGRRVEVVGDAGTVTGTVSAIQFTSSGPLLSVTTAAGDALPNIRLSQVSLVRN